MQTRHGIDSCRPEASAKRSRHLALGGEETRGHQIAPTALARLPPSGSLLRFWYLLFLVFDRLVHIEIAGLPPGAQFSSPAASNCRESGFVR